MSKAWHMTWGRRAANVIRVIASLPHWPRYSIKAKQSEEIVIELRLSLSSTHVHVWLIILFSLGSIKQKNDSWMIVELLDYLFSFYSYHCEFKLVWPPWGQGRCMSSMTTQLRLHVLLEHDCNTNPFFDLRAFMGYHCSRKISPPSNRATPCITLFGWKK